MIKNQKRNKQACQVPLFYMNPAPVLAFFIVILFLFFFSYPLYSDAVVMKDGKKYGGIIIDFNEGKYILKNKGKKYVIAESKVESIKWSATKAMLNEAFSGEKFRQDYDRRTIWYETGVSVGYCILTTPGISDSWGPGMLMIGTRLGSMPYTKDFSYYMGFYYGNMSGTLTYREPGAVTDSMTPISGDSLYIFNGPYFKFPIKGLPLIPFINLNLGVGVTFEKLDSYPMGWERYSTYDDSMLNPDMVDNIEVSSIVPSAVASALVGVDIEASELIDITVKCGYFAVTKTLYNNPKLFRETVDLGPTIDASVIASGLYIECGLKFRY